MSEFPSHLAAALADRYRIEEEIGAGGMATVYLAHDVRHHRRVALKVLRPELAATLGPDRFLNEIRIAANLTHPHILPVHDSGNADGFLYYVMPYIQGESLRDKLAREGELPVADVARILRDVVDALAAAHDQGVVHRDVKPDNVLVTGRHALVMDFGVAKAVSEATGRHQLTTAGVALGTPHYMAPEQATADPHVDHRADIYAVGAMAYELLTGRPPFAGVTAQAILAAHVTEPVEPVTTHRPSVPPPFADLVMRCLEKKPADRWQRAADMLPVLEALGTPSGGITPTTTQPLRAASRIRVGRAAAVGAFAIVAVVAILRFGAPGPDGPSIAIGATTQVTFDPDIESEVAISPDGRTVAYTVGNPPRTAIVVRQVEGGRTLPLADDFARAQRGVTWTPDGARIAFVGDDDRAYEVPALGGVPRPLLDARIRALAWSPDGSRLAFAGGDTVWIRDVATGATQAIVARRIANTLAWSPGGGRLAFGTGESRFTNIAPAEIAVVDVTAHSEPVTVAADEYFNVSPTWLSDDGLLFISNRGGGRDVYHVSLDGDGRPRGEPERVTTGLDAEAISVAADGRSLAYVTVDRRANIWSFAVPATGEADPSDLVPVTTGRQQIEGIVISPDGEWLVFDSDRSGHQDLYVRRRDGGEVVQLTDHPAGEFARSISPDGQWLAGHNFRHGDREIYIIGLDGTRYERVTTTPEAHRYPDWSPDGSKLVYSVKYPNRPGFALEVVERRENGWSEPVPVAEGTSEVVRWAPDGRTVVSNRGADLLAFPVDGSEPRVVFSARIGGVVGFEWWPGRDALIVRTEERPLAEDAVSGQLASGEQVSLWVVPWNGQPPRRIIRFDRPERQMHRAEFAVWNDRVYLTIGEFQSDVWVMELQRDD